MSTYAEIQKQITELQKKAAQLKTQERQQAIAQAKALIAEHGLSAQELGLSGNARKSARNKSKVKYRDGQGNTWSGGRGRKPDWVKAILAAGQDIEKYAV
jgi:DNA-binding protein H-NS